MKEIGRSLGALVLALGLVLTMAIASPVRASTTGIDLGVSIDGLGTSDVRVDQYWSGAYAKAVQDSLGEVDYQWYSLGSAGDPWPDLATITASASLGGAKATGKTDTGQVWLNADAELVAGHSVVYASTQVAHWIDFTVLEDGEIEVGVLFDEQYSILNDDPSHSSAIGYTLEARLFQWNDEYDDWDEVDGTRDSHTDSIDGIGDLAWSPDDEYTFDPIGEGIYSLRISGTAATAISSPVVPAPESLLLAGLGIGLVASLRQRWTR
jgi:hypothetical protein